MLIRSQGCIRLRTDKSLSLFFPNESSLDKSLHFSYGVFTLPRNEEASKQGEMGTRRETECRSSVLSRSQKLVPS